MVIEAFKADLNLDYLAILFLLCNTEFLHFIMLQQWFNVFGKIGFAQVSCSLLGNGDFSEFPLRIAVQVFCFAIDLEHLKLLGIYNSQW